MTDFSLIPVLPNRIDVEPTTNCNFACVMCQRTYWNRKSRDMRIDDFIYIYDSFPKIDLIKIQGVGEPLLNKDLFKMIRYSKQHGSHVTTYTNGSLLHLQDNAVKLLDSGIDLVKISIDGGSQKTYEKIRVKGDFERLVANITMISKLRNGVSFPQIELWTIGLPQNLHELNQIIDICDMAGIETMHVQLFLITFGYKADVGETLTDLQLHHYRPAAIQLRQAMEYAQKKGIQLKLFAANTYSLKNPCPRPFHSLFISVEGYVVPCAVISDPRTIHLGNIFEEGLKDIWKSEKFQRFRLSLLEGNLHQACQNCYRESNNALISEISM